MQKFLQKQKLIQKSRKSYLYLLPKFHELFFFKLINWILKNKIIIQPINAKPEEVLQYLAIGRDGGNT
jgi:hypothetical protein